MAFDAHKNFAVSAVATAPSPATSGTTLAVTAAQGTRFPATPFNAVVHPSDAIPTPANAEIVRVTGISTDTLTITRAQEGSTARSIVAGDRIYAAVTAKSLTDVEADASATTKGLVRLSAAPAVATDPVVVGENDPRLVAAPASVPITADQPGTFVAVAETATLVADVNPGRSEIRVTNDSDTVVYLRLGTGAALSRGIRLNPNGGNYTTESYTGALTGIQAVVGATKTLLIVEV